MPNLVIRRNENGTVMTQQVDTGERRKSPSDLDLERLQKEAAAVGKDLPQRPKKLTRAQKKAAERRAARKATVGDHVPDNDKELEEFLAQEREAEARIAAQRAAEGGEDGEEDEGEGEDGEEDEGEGEDGEEDEGADARLEAELQQQEKEEELQQKAPTFPCPQCEFSAGTESGLKRHIGAKHG